MFVSDTIITISFDFRESWSFIHLQWITRWIKHLFCSFRLTFLPQGPHSIYAGRSMRCFAPLSLYFLSSVPIFTKPFLLFSFSNSSTYSNSFLFVSSDIFFFNSVLYLYSISILTHNVFTRSNSFVSFHQFVLGGGQWEASGTGRPKA